MREPTKKSRKRFTEKAVKSLLKHSKSSDAIYLQISLKEPLIKRPNRLTKLISLPHPFKGDIHTAAILLIVNDAVYSNCRKELMDNPKSPTKGVFTEIVSISKLRRRLHSSRDFLSSFDVILVHKKISETVKSILGDKMYRSSRKCPASIAIFGPKTVKSPPKLLPKLVLQETQNVLNSTSVIVTPNNDMTVIIGYTHMGQRALQENIDSALDLIAMEIIKKDRNVVSAFIKTPESPALPILADTSEPEPSTD